MDVLVRYENGERFEATLGKYTLTSGKGADGDESRDGMPPADIVAAATGMCIGIYVVSHCSHHDIPCEGLTISVSRESAKAPSRTTRIEATIHMPGELTEKQRDAILRVAERCHVSQSLRRGVEVTCSLEAGR